MVVGDHRAGKRITILMADDDEDDCEFARGALAESEYVADMRFVGDGQELVDYLRLTGAYASPEAAERPRPSIILLDLKMPRKDGREALAEIKADADLRRIPVVVLTAYGSPEEVRRLYDLGASSFIAKPVTGESLRRVLARLARYWSQIVTLPEPGLG